MLIEGSSGSSGGLVGEHQLDELMRDGGRWAGRPLAWVHVAGLVTVAVLAKTADVVALRLTVKLGG